MIKKKDKITHRFIKSGKKLNSADLRKANIRSPKSGKKLTPTDLPRPKLLEEVDFQIGTSKESIDKKFVAMKPGKRESKYGNVYYEYRKNRTDKKGNI